MKSQPLTLLAATIATTFFSIDAYASMAVYTQAPNSPNSFVQSTVQNLSGTTATSFDWGNDAMDQQTWNYFTVASNISFNRIGWYGTNADGDFAVDLFATTCFSCGATPVGSDGTFPVTLLPNPGPFSQTDVHKTLVSGNLYSYYIDLTSSLTLDHTQAYALSVVNNYSTLPFAWAVSNPSGTHVQYLMTAVSYQFLPGPGNMAFTLTDTSASPVPIPASAWLLGSGLISLLGIARKRKIT